MTPLRPTKEGKWLRILIGDVRTFYGAVALGNGTEYRIGLMRTRRNSGVFIGIEGRGAYEFHGPGHWGYVAEKLGLKHELDARNVADFLNTQFDDRLETQGEYNERFCKEANDGEEGYENEVRTRLDIKA